MNIGFVSLGCPKNRVDTEIMMAILKNTGHKIVNSLVDADAVIINTCGFINSAQEEAIDTIIETGKLKENGKLKYLIATGCLTQRFGLQLLDELPELDGIAGIASLTRIHELIAGVQNGERIMAIEPVPEVFLEKGPRLLSTPPGSAYLKISEGCNNRCSYCTIPSIRGNLRSRPLEELVLEARDLAKRGVKEIVLVAQDTGVYGWDLYGRHTLTDLLKEINKIEGLVWIRLMYLHPLHISDELIDTLTGESKIIPYLDIPIQHAANKILKLMNRQHDTLHLRKLVADLRHHINDLVLRTTVMVGFPDETEDDFKQLYDFVGETEFDCLGVFAYAAEEGTPAAVMEAQVAEEVKLQRLHEISALQQKISRRKNIARLDTQVKILVSSQSGKNLYLGRGYYQAPEVDGLTVVKSKSRLTKGEFYDVQLVGVRNYDMIGELVDEPAE
ncbi:MAG: 30S ribosomal protein S12 methylthiotransferase RimO [Syntrophomonas sp.]